jgi:glycosyltransferase involved in cell wall biosynthesis
MRKIKVCQVITRMDWGGSPDVLRLLCWKLDPDIYELKIFIGSTSHPSEKTRLFFAAFEPQITFVPELKREIDLWNDWLAFWKLFRVFKKEKFDIVHTHTAKAGALGRLAACLAGVPAIIHTPHGHNFYGYFNRFFSAAIILIEKFLSIFTCKIMVLTQLERNDYLKFRVAGDKKIILIYMGLELDKFIGQNPQKFRSNLNIDPSEKLVGFVGRLDPIKGAQVFVRAAGLCLKADTRAKFILAGEGALRRKLEESAESAGFNGRVIFVGWREDVADVMSALDILVLPSLNEAAGMVLIEAQSLGVPVIASNVGGIPEMIKQGQTGILVPANDPEALASAIKELLSDPQRLQAMSEAGRSWVKSRFKAEDMTARIIDVYFQALKEKHVIV